MSLSTVAPIVALGQARSRSCPWGAGGFYIHLDSEETDAFHYHCNGESFFCSQPFINHLLHHPCRTRTLTRETPVAVVNVMHRALEQSALEQSFRYSLRVLRRMPAHIREAKHLYVFAGGEMWLYGGYERAIPSQAVFFSQEPLFWRAGSLMVYDEKRVPQTADACYVYAPSKNVVVVPYAGSLDRGFDPAAGNRPYRVAFYAALHGRAWQLRKRLYQLCDAQQQLQHGRKPWLCWTHRLPGGMEPMLQRFQRSDFCFCPAGDGPLRTTVWQALRRGCIPVLFSSCPHGALLEAYHPYFLPKDTTSPRFGVRRWSVLLNQTAAMLSDHYVADALAAVTEEQLLGMRRELRRHAERMSFFVNHTARKQARTFLRAREPALLSGDAMTFIVRSMVQKDGGAPMRAALPPFADTMALDFVPRATNDGRTCATKACRHRRQRGVRGNYSHEFGDSSTTVHRPLRRPDDQGRACAACVIGSTVEPAASAEGRFGPVRVSGERRER